jgi:hypothetical protein
MFEDDFIGYVGDENVHDSRILKIEQTEKRVVMTLLDINEFTYKMTFKDVYKIKSSNPYDIDIWGLAEMKSKYPDYRYFVFLNNHEKPDDYLEIYAKNFDIDKSNREFLPRTRNIIRDLANEGVGIKEYGMNYNPIENITEAMKFDDSYVVMEEGRYCEYLLICPLKNINCSEKTLHILLIELNRKWNGYDITNAATIYYQRHQPGDKLRGETGIVTVKQDLWLNKKFRSKKLKKKIIKVLKGELFSIMN